MLQTLKELSILAMKPDILIVTGDHSTPAVAKSHTSHPVPFMIAGDGVRSDGTPEFGERACAKGTWGTISGQVLLLKKYGA